MPYLPIDFDGREECERAAGVLGVHPGVLSWALQEVWLYTWRRKQAGKESPDILSELLLLGCLGQLGASPRTPETLVSFGFLERVGDAYRVRGAAKWLFGMEGRSRGGHAAKGNLIPGGRKTQPSQPSGPKPKTSAALGSGLGSAEGLAEGQPVGSTSALTANSQQPKESKNTAGEAPAAKEQADPRRRELSDMLCADFSEIRGEKYDFDGPRDGKALGKLLKKGTLQEIRAKWRKALCGSGLPSDVRASNFAQLEAKWNDIATGTGPPKQPARDPSRPLGIVANLF
jgi:hypothetical protein